MARWSELPPMKIRCDQLLESARLSEVSTLGWPRPMPSTVDQNSFLFAERRADISAGRVSGPGPGFANRHGIKNRNVLHEPADYAMKCLRIHVAPIAVALITL